MYRTRSVAHADADLRVAERLRAGDGRRGGREPSQLPHLNFPWTSVERLDLAAGRKCFDSCDKRLPLAAFKEDSDGGGVL